MKVIYVDDEKPALVNFESAVKNIEEIKKAPAQVCGCFLACINLDKLWQK